MAQTEHQDKIPTREEVEALKQNWEEDACWDLERTEGFEFVVEELREYRLQKEAEWETQRIARLQAKSEQLGIPGDHEAAQDHEALKRALDEAKDRLIDWGNGDYPSWNQHDLYKAIDKALALCEYQGKTILRLEQKVHKLQELVQTINADLGEVENDFRMSEAVRIWGPGK